MFVSGKRDRRHRVVQRMFFRCNFCIEFHHEIVVAVLIVFEVDIIYIVVFIAVVVVVVVVLIVIILVNK